MVVKKTLKENMVYMIYNTLCLCFLLLNIKSNNIIIHSSNIELTLFVGCLLL